jgi:hypothetical protein
MMAGARGSCPALAKHPQRWDATLNDATTAIRPFQDHDEAAVVGVWYRSGQTAYRFLPSWQELTLERAGDIFREVIRPRCSPVEEARRELPLD